MNSKEALNFVESIEAHREAEKKMWERLREDTGYQMHEDKVLEAIIAQRASARELNEQSLAEIAAFDLEFDDDGELIENTAKQEN